MSYVVTAATGQLGRQVVTSLLARGIPADQIVATARDLDRLQAELPAGVRAARVDYSDPSTIRAALSAGDRVLLVSGNEFGQRVAQHGAVVEAAKAAGVALLAYTSAPYATTTSMALAAEHAATEQVLAKSGLTTTILRNGWYLENYAPAIAGALASGEVVGATQGGVISVGPRSEYAEAAAAALADPSLDGSVLELGGDPVDGAAFTLPALAAELSRLTGREIAYREVSVGELEQILQGVGMPAEVAGVMADVDRAIGAGELQITSGDLARLLGRPTADWRTGVAALVAAAESESGAEPAA